MSRRRVLDPAGFVDGWLEEQGYTVKTRQCYVTLVRRADRWLREHRDDVRLDAATADDLSAFMAVQTPSIAAQARVALVAFYKACGDEHGRPAVDLRPTGDPHARERMAELDVLALWRRELRGFERWLITRRYAPRTRKSYLRHVARCAAVLDADLGVSLETATVDDLEHYWSALSASTASNCNQARAALQRYYQHLGRRHGEPADELPALPEPRGIPRALSDAEFLALIAAAVELGGDHELAGLMFAHTGCRFTELHLARWSAFDLDRASPSWRVVGKGARRSGPKERIVPLRGDLVDVLRARRAQSRSAFLFPSPKAPPDRPMSGPVLRAIVADIAHHAGCHDITPHRFRHTVATVALRETLDLRGVQELLGHANLATTSLYTKVLPDRLRLLVESLPARTTDERADTTSPSSLTLVGRREIAPGH